MCNVILTSKQEQQEWIKSAYKCDLISSRKSRRMQTINSFRLIDIKIKCAVYLVE